MRITLFYIVGITGVALALLVALGVGLAWTRLVRGRRDHEGDGERFRSHQPRPMRRAARADALRVMTSRMTRPPAAAQLHFSARCDPQAGTPAHRHDATPAILSQPGVATTRSREQVA